MGVARDHLIFVDSNGVIHAGREEGMNEYRARFAVDTDRRTTGELWSGPQDGATAELRPLVD